MSELQVTASVGCRRYIAHLLKGTPQTNGLDGGNVDRWSLDIESAAAEMAVARYFGKYWVGASDDKTTDVAGNIEVRHSTHENSHLLLYRSDPDNRKFVLVTGRAPRFCLRGWIYGRDGKQERFWKDYVGNGRQAFWVPQSELHPIPAQQ